MSDVFNGANKFNQNIGSWNVSKAVGMTAMFALANQLIQILIGMWPSCNMDSMFLNAYKFNQDISTWNISAVVNGAVCLMGQINLILILMIGQLI